MSNINPNYHLALVTVLSIGVLSGCEYCITLLAASLLLPVVQYATKKISTSFQSALRGGITS